VRLNAHPAKIKPTSFPARLNGFAGMDININININILGSIFILRATLPSISMYLFMHFKVSNSPNVF
jgi:hypothetical protein